MYGNFFDSGIEGLISDGRTDCSYGFADYFMGDEEKRMYTESEFLQARELIGKANRIVFFGGAGVSTESGIPDFRSQDGLYNQKYKHPPEQILSHTFFLRHTEEFYEFYREKMLFPDAKPNSAHYKLAQWEKEGKLSAVITQNIDGLHQKAGSKKVLELHGSIWRNTCMQCGKTYPLEKILNSTGIVRCDCGGIVKPDVVLYEEPLDGAVLEEAVKELERADLLLIGGTSLNVYPASGLIDYFGGNNIIVINKGEPLRKLAGVLFLDGKIGEIFSKFK